MMGNHDNTMITLSHSDNHEAPNNSKRATVSAPLE